MGQEVLSSMGVTLNAQESDARDFHLDIVRERTINTQNSHFANYIFTPLDFYCAMLTPPANPRPCFSRQARRQTRNSDFFICNSVA